MSHLLFLHRAKGAFGTWSNRVRNADRTLTSLQRRPPRSSPYVRHLRRQIHHLYEIPRTPPGSASGASVCCSTKCCEALTRKVHFPGIPSAACWAIRIVNTSADA